MNKAVQDMKWTWFNFTIHGRSQQIYNKVSHILYSHLKRQYTLKELVIQVAAMPTYTGPATSDFNALDLELDMKIWLTAASGCEYHKMTD
jgi:hypothetical protein